jgi:hypothetical protein
MDGFSVTPADLVVAAHDLQELGDRIVTTPVGRYGVNPRECGDEELAAAITLAQEASLDATALLSATARSTGRRLLDTAELYVHQDQKSAERFEALGSRYSDG